MVRGRGRSIRGRGNGRVQAEDEVAAEPNMAEVMAQLSKFRNNRPSLNNLQANANRVEVPINTPAAQPTQDRGVQAATNHEPLYLRFKRMKPKEFNGSTEPWEHYDEFNNFRQGNLSVTEAAAETSTVVTCIDKDILSQGFTTTLPSGEVMMSTHWLRAVPMRIVDRELYSNLIVLEMFDYDLILGMDFLGK
ncbi:hypothetical protein TIFTF001_044926 [Ficus carica]|uniref:Uncharacterized protein n=1 Tax=Ficus carica TaxID=3494 RepID=A0AA87ZKF3_FICCA|nr:hypothetical protein TIFTF001_044926 [Ficus carica]